MFKVAQLPLGDILMWPLLFAQVQPVASVPQDKIQDLTRAVFARIIRFSFGTYLDNAQ